MNKNKKDKIISFISGLLIVFVLFAMAVGGLNILYQDEECPNKLMPQSTGKRFTDCQNACSRLDYSFYYEDNETCPAKSKCLCFDTETKKEKDMSNILW